MYSASKNVPQTLRNPGGSSQYSQQPTTCLWPEPRQPRWPLISVYPRFKNEWTYDGRYKVTSPIFFFQMWRRMSFLSYATDGDTCPAPPGSSVLQSVTCVQHSSSAKRRMLWPYGLAEGGDWICYCGRLQSDRDSKSEKRAWCGCHRG